MDKVSRAFRYVWIKKKQRRIRDGVISYVSSETP